MSSVVINEVRRGFYLDSVALMRVSATIAGTEGIEEAALMMATPANKQIMADAGILGPLGEDAQGGDLVCAVRAVSEAAARAAIADAVQLLDQPRRSGGGDTWRPKSLRQAVKATPSANLALISVSGEFAVAEARKAINAGLHAMIFSDNVPLAEERSLKQEALKRNRLVMGPDCGTAIIGGVPLAFANVLPRGDIGIIGASGTGMQEVSCLLARQGSGISHAIGVGGRDLKQEIGGITTLMALDVFDEDKETRHVIVISKPPAAAVTQLVLDRVAKSPKTFTVCFIGAEPLGMPANAVQAFTLEEAVQRALGLEPIVENIATSDQASAGRIAGLFCGGTLCAESQVVLLSAGLSTTSNIPIPGASPITSASSGHSLVDLGDDEFTQGKPHPMIDPGVRDAALRDALADASVAVILLDVVLGHGAHADPAGHLIASLGDIAASGKTIVASVTGTDGDPQVRAGQVAKLEAAGIQVAQSNAAAARLAIQHQRLQNSPVTR